MRRRLAVALLVAAGAGAPASPAPREADARYLELVRAYAAGDRAVAAAGIAGLDADALRSGVDSLAGHPTPVLMAAIMLHTDRRLLEGRARVDATETTPSCTSAHTEAAGRVAQRLLLHADGVDFVRRWYVAMALQDQWDGCFEDALRWSDAAARGFANDSEVLLARAALYEAVATLPSRLPRPFGNVGPSARKTILVNGAQATTQLQEARRSLEHLLAARTQNPQTDPATRATIDVARVRLGRVLWRLGRMEEARRTLEAVLAGEGENSTRHLAHLFLARVHQDGGREDEALRSLRAAVEVQPTSQAGALGLADALQLAGEADAARATVEAALALAGRRPDPQSFWEYMFGFSRRGGEELDALRDEVPR